MWAWRGHNNVDAWAQKWRVYCDHTVMKEAQVAMWA